MLDLMYGQETAIAFTYAHPSLQLIFFSKTSTTQTYTSICMHKTSEETKHPFGAIALLLADSNSAARSGHEELQRSTGAWGLQRGSPPPPPPCRVV
jgi:hypothetical protein